MTPATMRQGAGKGGRRRTWRRVTEERQTSNKDVIFSRGAACNSGGEFRVILLGLLLAFSLAASEAKGPAELVETMATWTARLPCRVKDVDTPLLVLWYRRHENHPFYSYDARTANISSGEGRIHDDDLGPRSRFVLVEGAAYLRGSTVRSDGVQPIYPGTLAIRQVSREDAGAFTCRVDFLNSPTQNHRLRLIVYEEPSFVTVLDGRGRRVTAGPGGVLTTSPINHTSPLLLTCNVRGGWPSPSIVWYRGGRVLPSSTDNGGDGSLGSRLFISSLKPDDYMSEVQCVVANNNLTAPIRTRVRIDMNIEPARVVITGVQEGLVAGARHEVKCESWGSRPPANLTWDLEGQLDWSPIEISQTITRTGTSESRVVWLVQPEDNQRKLSCTATNPRNHDYILTNSTALTVFHPPVVKLTIGRGLDPSAIKEGADVYFTCRVRANPVASRIVFFHEGREVLPQKREEGGVLVTEDSLVLQKVTRDVSGRYSCRATNARGSHTSNSVPLDVLYEPRCVIRSRVVTVTPGDNVTLECDVDAFPSPRRFSWSLNTTKGLHVVPKDEYEVSGSSSRYLHTTPLTLKETIALCWAVNDLGALREPCKTTLVAAGSPGPVEECVVVEQRSSLRVSCEPGFDGGLEQRFIAQVVEPVRKRVVANVSAATPEFSIGDLAPGLDYVVQVFAYNKRGRSTPYLLDGFSLKVAENRIDSGPSGPAKGASPLLALFIGVVAAFVLTLAVIIAATKLRCRVRLWARGREEAAGSSRSDDSEDDELQTRDEAKAGGSRRSSAEVKLMSVVRQEEHAHAEDELKQRQGPAVLHAQEPGRECCHFDAKTTTESLYSTCSGRRCGLGCPSRSSLLLSSSLAAASQPACCASVCDSCDAGRGSLAMSGGVNFVSGSAVASGGPLSVTSGSASMLGGSMSLVGGPVCSRSMVGAPCGSLEHPLSQSWHQYGGHLHLPAASAPRDAGVACTRRPSESFV